MDVFFLFSKFCCFFLESCGEQARAGWVRGVFFDVFFCLRCFKLLKAVGKKWIGKFRLINSKLFTGKSDTSPQKSDSIWFSYGFLRRDFSAIVWIRILRCPLLALNTWTKQENRVRHLVEQRRWGEDVLKVENHTSPAVTYPGWNEDIRIRKGGQTPLKWSHLFFTIVRSRFGNTESFCSDVRDYEILWSNVINWYVIVWHCLYSRNQEDVNSSSTL